jgi:hypothetical protein
MIQRKGEKRRREIKREQLSRMEEFIATRISTSFLFLMYYFNISRNAFPEEGCRIHRLGPQKK